MVQGIIQLSLEKTEELAQSFRKLTLLAACLAALATTMGIASGFRS